ncbi:hypothetical protein [Saccharopolyspora gloriosae]|uniref:hypothetical protein n=1 Tax=Saccharopolyspora gloriosae TaxID=455344 RepID=UPI001FB71496|nr:hypothetical protein [Saccharopolyspora gloriosae]
MHPYPGSAPPLVTIGDIACTQDEVITPSGRAPIANTTWTFTDMSRTTREIPVWAIVCAIVFFFLCLLGLLLLLVREERTQGTVQVTVQGQGLLHVTQIPVFAPAAVMDLGARVNYARNLAFRG